MLCHSASRFNLHSEYYVIWPWVCPTCRMLCYLVLGFPYIKHAMSFGQEFCIHSGMLCYLVLGLPYMRNDKCKFKMIIINVQILSWSPVTCPGCNSCGAGGKDGRASSQKWLELRCS
jgi:hypothetical protein